MPNIKREFLAAMEEAWDLGYDAGVSASTDDAEPTPYTVGYLSQIIHQEISLTASWVSPSESRSVADRAARQILRSCKVKPPPRDAMLDRALADAIANLDNGSLRPMFAPGSSPHAPISVTRSKEGLTSRPQRAPRSNCSAGPSSPSLLGTTEQTNGGR